MACLSPLIWALSHFRPLNGSFSGRWSGSGSRWNEYRKTTGSAMEGSEWNMDVKGYRWHCVLWYGIVMTIPGKIGSGSFAVQTHGALSSYMSACTVTYCHVS